MQFRLEAAMSTTGELFVAVVHLVVVPHTIISIGNQAISQLLLAWFWPNFQGRVLGPSLPDSNCHDDICPGNICLRNICPYQEYITCYLPDFDQILKVGSRDHLEKMPTVVVTFVQARFVLATFVHIRNISAAAYLILTLKVGSWDHLW